MGSYKAPRYSLDDLQFIDDILSCSGIVSHGKTRLSSSDSSDEKPRLSKRPDEDSIPEKVSTSYRNKNKLEHKLEGDLNYPPKRVKNVQTEVSAGSIDQKSSQCGFICRETSLLDQQGEGNAAPYYIYKAPQLRNYLLAFALNPFHGVEHDVPAVVLQFFLRFRTVVRQKTFSGSRSADEFLENLPSESPAYNDTTKNPIVWCFQQLPSALKPLKKRLRPDNYGVVGRNWSNSSSKEENSKKRLKELTDLESLSVGKKGGNHKPLKSEGTDVKGDATPRTKSTKYLVTRAKTQRKAAQPVMLGMQFPRGSALPSVSELKARFARFGPFYYMPRVLWKSSTCLIVFKCEPDAKAAYRHASQDKSLFGDAKVEYYLKALAPSLEVPKPGKPVNEIPQSALLDQQQLVHSTTQIKSSLEKLKGSETRSATVVRSLKPAVRFMLSEDESNGAELMVKSDGRSTNTLHSSGSYASYQNFEISENWQKVIYLPSSPLLPLSNQNPSDALVNCELIRFVDACNAKYQTEGWNDCNCMKPTAPDLDISSQMLSLMTRCNDIISFLKSRFGYVPTHL